MIPHSNAQHTLLVECLRREQAGMKPEHFAPNPATVRALVRRGLVTARLIGQRWWAIQLTEAGRRCV